jgi:hypothetical protein
MTHRLGLGGLLAGRVVVVLGMLLGFAGQPFGNA